MSIRIGSRVKFSHGGIPDKQGYVIGAYAEDFWTVMYAKGGGEVALTERKSEQLTVIYSAPSEQSGGDTNG